MAKTVTIPDFMKPNWECEIGNTKYSYEAGSEQEVPDGVAEVIENYVNSLPKIFEPDEDLDLPFGMATTILTDEDTTLTFDHDLGKKPSFSIVFASDPTEVISNISYKVVALMGLSGTTSVSTAYDKNTIKATSLNHTVTVDEEQIVYTNTNSTYKFATGIEYTCIYW